MDYNWRYLSAAVLTEQRARCCAGCSHTEQNNNICDSDFLYEVYLVSACLSLRHHWEAEGNVSNIIDAPINTHLCYILQRYQRQQHSVPFLKYRFLCLNKFVPCIFSFTTSMIRSYKIVSFTIASHGTRLVLGYEEEIPVYQLSYVSTCTTF